MGSQEQQPMVRTHADAHSPEIIANAFVLQYYYIFRYSPELVHRFYCDNSSLGRPEANGQLCCVTTMKEINEKIMSLNRNLMPEIKKIDAQASFEGGVTVLVTGNMISQDGTINKNFTQSFFLAPQDNGYFVLNDMFRYVGDSNVQCETNGILHQTETHLVQENGIVLPSEQNILGETTPAIKIIQANIEKVTQANGEVIQANNEEACELSDNGVKSVVNKELTTNVSVCVPTETQVDIESIKSVMTQVSIKSNKNDLHEEISKKSYASIVKVMKGNISPLSPPKNISKPVSVKPEQTIKPSQSLSNGSHNSISNSINNDHGNVRVAEERFSIYIKNLPMDVNPAHLEVVFKSFGPIKKNGIQVRYYKHQDFCFAFVVFEETNAVQKAIEASPILINGCQAYVEGKRTNSRGRNSVGFRNGNYIGGGKGYARGGDFGNRGGGRWGYQRSNNGGCADYTNGNSSRNFENGNSGRNFENGNSGRNLENGNK